MERVVQIHSVSIKNFRSIKDQKINCTDYNVFVGSNGAGKSTILQALNVFFGDYKNFSEDDFWNRETDEPIEIAVEFNKFSEAALEVFTHYVRHGKMKVVAEVSMNADRVFHLSMYGERLVNSDFAPFFEAPSSPASVRKSHFDKIRENYPNIENQSSDKKREQALREHEERMPESEKTLLRSGDSFFGITKGSNRIKEFVTWVYIPAVKDAIGEAEEARGSHLGRLIQHTVRNVMNYAPELQEIRQKAEEQYDLMLEKQIQHFSKLESRLSGRLNDLVTEKTSINLKWRPDSKSISIQDPNAAVILGDDNFKGDVNSFGHGLQRAFLLSVLQENLNDNDEQSPNLILGCEEPELYQHPPQARHMASVLQNLTKNNDQVFITTHSPYFVNVDSLGGLKKVSRKIGKSKIFSSDWKKITDHYNEFFEDTERKLSAVRAKLAIQIQPKANEIFFSDFVVLVEGVSDQATIEAYLRLSKKDSEFRRLGGSIIEASGKSSLAIILLMLKEYEIPCFVIFDCDGKSFKKENHIKDNLTLFKLVGHTAAQPFPCENVLKNNFMAWENTIEDAIKPDYGDNWDDARECGCRAVGHLTGYKKNPMFIATAMQYAWDKGCDFSVLENLIDKIIQEAKIQKNPKSVISKN